jgi:hypothetical protein
MYLLRHYFSFYCVVVFNLLTIQLINSVLLTLPNTAVETLVFVPGVEIN